MTPHAMRHQSGHKAGSRIGGHFVLSSLCNRRNAQSDPFGSALALFPREFATAPPVFGWPFNHHKDRSGDSARAVASLG